MNPAPAEGKELRKVAGVKAEDDGLTPVEDFLAVEEALQIKLNGQPFTIIMRTPGADDYLVRGLLFTEGVVNSETYHFECETELDPQKQIPIAINVQVPEIYLCRDAIPERSLPSTSSCGICGKVDLTGVFLDGPALTPREPLDLELLTALPDKMQPHQQIFHCSGGTHAAAAFSYGGELLAVFEDIGRHNAVDKVVGSLLAARGAGPAYMLVSGRISYEIVAKTYRAGIPCVAGVSAPSSLAVEMGKNLGLSVVGFCREGRATIYSQPQHFDLRPGMDRTH